MKYSRLFGKTVRKAKSDMVKPSHQLLYRGGFIRELSSGRYEFLPLGFRVWRKVVDLVDNQMKKIGSQRFSIPILQPIEIWKKTNRDSAWGPELMRIKDRNESEFALSATGEGVVTEMVAETRPSYKDLPIVVHQFIIKLRDEMRARGGLLRTREFVMKDAYSFNRTEEEFMKTYEDFWKAYGRIAQLLGLEYYACIADSGALGGDYCHEFQVPCESGEDQIAVCKECNYAANLEKAEFERKEINNEEEVLDYKTVELPENVKTIKDLIQHYDMPAERFIKNVVYTTKDKKFIIATVPGHLDINKIKLERVVGETELEKAEAEDLVKIGTKPGYVHSWGYEKHKDNITFVADLSIPKAKNLYGGFKTETTDPQNVNYGRDFEADIVADIADPYEGAKCKKCGGKLEIIRTIEYGHIFKYDHFYTKHHDGYFTDEDGKKKLMYMGAYGIGIGRAIAATVEIHHDQDGIIWPITIAPFQVHLITLGEEKEIIKKSERLYNKLEENNIEVIWDKREDVSAGIKFSDSDLIGIPIRIVVSKRSFENGGYEIKRRDKSNSDIISEENALKDVQALIKKMKEELKSEDK